MRKQLLLALSLLLTMVTNAETLVVLDNLTTDYQAHTGDVLTGSLQHNVHITIAHNATVTLRNAIILGTNSRTYEWSGIDCQGNATLILEGSNTVQGYYDAYPGISVEKDYTLTIEGSGTLMVSSNGRGAGIGSGWSGLESLGGGYVRAYDSFCGHIVINGGTIYAYGGDRAAGIGNGYDSRCQSITITSNVNGVYAKCGSNATYAIGGGWWCGDIQIGGRAYLDGVVGDAQRSFTYVPWKGDLSKLTGDAEVKDGSTITGTLTQPYKISIPDGAHIKLKNASINYAGTTWDNTPFGGLNCNGNATIEIIGDETNIIYGIGKGYPAIHVPAGKTLHLIGDGVLMAYGALWGAGIGGGSAVDCGNIHIGGSLNIYAEGGCDYAAGIGGGYNKNNGTITIDNTVRRVKVVACESASCIVGAGYGSGALQQGKIHVGGRTYNGCIDDNPFIYVGTNQQGIETTPSDSPSRGEKVLRDGKLYIVVGEKMYDARGVEVR